MVGVWRAKLVKFRPSYTTQIPPPHPHFRQNFVKNYVFTKIGSKRLKEGFRRLAAMQNSENDMNENMKIFPGRPHHTRGVMLTVRKYLSPYSEIR